MKNFLFVLALVVSAVCLRAQSFEGTVKWKITSEITDPDVKAQMEKMKDPANQAKMKEMQAKMNDPQFKAMMESNPQMKTQLEAMTKAMANGGGVEAMMPSGLIIKVKGKNTSSHYGRRRCRRHGSALPGRQEPNLSHRPCKQNLCCAYHR